MENYSLSDIAAASNDGGFGGGSAWVLIILFALIFGWNGGGFGGGQNASAQDIQRAVDLNSIQEGQAGIAADVQRGIYEINGATKDAAYNNLSEIRDIQSAVATGNANIINNMTAMQALMQNCCCEQKQLIMENRYLDEKNASNIMANDTANTQKILDAISQNKVEALQGRINQLEMQQALCGVPKVNPYLYGVYPYNTGCDCGNV